MNLLPVLPVIFFLIGAVVCIFLHPSRSWQRAVSLTTSLLALAASLVLAHLNLKGAHPILKLGNWDIPFGIVYVADPLACLMLIATALIGVGTSIYIWTTLKDEHEHLHFHFFFLILLGGVSAAFLTGDLFHLFVCFELLLISSFVLMSLGSSKAQLEGSVKYVSINLISSLLLVMSVGFLYSQTGTLSLADLAEKVPQLSEQNPWIAISGIMMLVSFGIKAGVFPLFFWLPASYHTPPTAIAALFAGLLTKVGVYSLMRIFPLLYFPNGTGFQNAFILIGALTMVIGVIGAVSQFTIKRILSIHIISQVGYIILAIGLESQIALAAAIFYTLHNMIAKTNLFFIGGIVEKIQGTDDLGHGGSLFKKAPILSLIFLISALGLAGIPPLSGFFAKLFVIIGAAKEDQYLAITISLAVSVLTLYSMLKIWNYSFWQPINADGETHLNKVLDNKETRIKLMPAYGVTAFFAALVLAMGVWASPVFDWTMQASESLSNPATYIEFVKGKKR
jgi:multicomponent Na+:H+ antiporter subunit D